MLRVRELTAFYGASQALFGMELAVDAGEVVTLMGRNGMGKTTTVNAIMGLVPEGRQIFPNLSVRENLVASAANRTSRGNPWTLERAYTFFPRLAERQRNMG